VTWIPPFAFYDFSSHKAAGAFYTDPPSSASLIWKGIQKFVPMTGSTGVPGPTKLLGTYSCVISALHAGASYTALGEGVFSKTGPNKNMVCANGALTFLGVATEILSGSTVALVYNQGWLMSGQPDVVITSTKSATNNVEVAYIAIGLLQDVELANKSTFTATNSVDGKYLPGLTRAAWPPFRAIQNGGGIAGLTAVSQAVSNSHQYTVQLFTAKSKSAASSDYRNAESGPGVLVLGPGPWSKGNAYNAFGLGSKTGVVPPSSGWDLTKCLGKAVQLGSSILCSGGARSVSAGVMTLFLRGSTLVVVTHFEQEPRNAATQTVELKDDVAVAKSVISLLASSGLG
jgi:hypothetical protein